jgi:hypothetical protein
MVTYLPQHVHDEAVQQNFDYIESHAVFTPPSGPVAVTGSRGGNAALASLLTELAAIGAIIDSTGP